VNWRRIVGAGGVVLIAALVTRLIAAASAVQSPAIGDRFPVQILVRSAATPVATSASRGGTVVIVVREGCAHCEWELTDLAGAMHRFPPATRVLILELPSGVRFARPAGWDSLARQPNVTWSRVTEAAVANAVGPVVTPLIFVLDSLDRVVAKYRGETSASRIEQVVTARK